MNAENIHGRKPFHIERDRMIARERRTGSTLQELADKYGLTSERIRQIEYAERKRRAKSKTPLLSPNRQRWP